MTLMQLDSELALMSRFCSNYALAMRTTQLLEELGYARSPYFLRPDRFGEALEHFHIFRRASESFLLHGVYVVREASKKGYDVSTPVVYVAEAKTKAEADEIHRKVWNQNVVPFLLVRVSEAVWLYSGFQYNWKTIPRSHSREQQGILEAAVALADVAKKLADFNAQAIDSGILWQRHGHRVDSKARVDWRLLDNLEKLGQWLQKEELDKEVANALIGKFVYLRYLHDRDILSSRKLREWGIDIKETFGRNATTTSIRNLVERVDEWLNGSIFPFPFSGKGAPRLEHMQRVAEIFLGDSVETGQYHLDFQAYDFSYIPIETLSVIYEQFLASEGKDKVSGAYYTPIPVVNFMLAEIDGHLPLKKGMRILDPACGSGAFLVQCYRRLIEFHFGARGRMPRPAELRDLLVRSIFGVDRDANACRVAALSLILTMLDYIRPPDLQATPTFKLPDLHNQNIFHADFFDRDAPWRRSSTEKGFDWIIGNPPWKPAGSFDQSAQEWMQEYAGDHPVARNQMAEAFAWRSASYAAPGGVIALLLPAMTFFRQSDEFRRAFFKSVRVLAVANFSNLRRDLFGDRVEEPAAAVIYAADKPDSRSQNVLVYSPLLVNQEFSRPSRQGDRLLRKETWGISISASEVRQIPYRWIEAGDSLPWKTAMWGSPRDLRLLNRVENKWPSLRSVAAERGIQIREGLQLRDKREVAREPIEPIPEVAGKSVLVVKNIRNRGRLYSIPPSALAVIEPDQAFVRKGRKDKPLMVCRPPHIIVSGARTFSVYTDEYVVVPPRQIGVAGPIDQRGFLKALSLYLSSDFAQYYEFFHSPQGGIREGRSTLETLLDMPCPLGFLSDSQTEVWIQLQGQLAEASTFRWPEMKSEGPLFDHIQGSSLELDELEKGLNNLVSGLLELDDAERWLIEDLVHIRRYLTDGNVGIEAAREPTEEELGAYGNALRDILNDFVGEECHRVFIVYDSRFGIVEVVLATDSKKDCVEVQKADTSVSFHLAESRRDLLGGAVQWMYFDRNMFISMGERLYVLKPMQLVSWARSQALMDADEILASSLVTAAG